LLDEFDADGSGALEEGERAVLRDRLKATVRGDAPPPGAPADDAS
jgi:hypothetical protein